MHLILVVYGAYTTKGLALTNPNKASQMLRPDSARKTNSNLATTLDSVLAPQRCILHKIRLIRCPP